MACGAWPAGPAPTTTNRSRPSSAPSISAAISSIPPGPTATATASSFSEKSCAPTKIIPPLADRTKNFTLPRKSRPKIFAGPRARNILSTIPIRRTISSSTWIRASKISASKRSISSSCTLGRTAGSRTNVSCAPRKNFAAAEKFAPSDSASTAGNPPTAFAPCAPVSSMPSRSSTISSTRIPRTNFSPPAAKKMLPSSPACLSTKAPSPARSRSTANGPRTIGAAPISFPKISKPASPAPTPSNLSSPPERPCRKWLCASFSIIPTSAPSFPACASSATSNPTSSPATKAPCPRRSTRNCANTAGTAPPRSGANRMDRSREKTTRFVSAHAQQASSSAPLARSAILRDRCARAACCEARPQSPAPSAPQLFACPRFSSHRRLPAFFRRRTLPASAHTWHPTLLGWSTSARKSQLLSLRPWSLRASLSAQYHIRSVNKSLPPACASRGKSHLHFSRPSVPCEIQPVDFSVRVSRTHLLTQGAPHGHQASFQEIRRCAATPHPGRATPSPGGATDRGGTRAPAHVPRWAAAHRRGNFYDFLGRGMETSRAKRDCHEHEFVFRLHSHERADGPARGIQRPRKKYRPWQTHRHRDAHFTRSKHFRAGQRDSKVIAAGNRGQESSGAYFQFTLFFLPSAQRAGCVGRQRFLPGVLRLSRLYQQQHFLCGHALPRMFRVHRRP